MNFFLTSFFSFIGKDEESRKADHIPNQTEAVNAVMNRTAHSISKGFFLFPARRGATNNTYRSVSGHPFDFRFEENESGLFDIYILSTPAKGFYADNREAEKIDPGKFSTCAVRTYSQAMELAKSFAEDFCNSQVFN